MLCVGNTDDPVIPPPYAEVARDAARANPNIISALTHRGGHLGWMQGWRAEPWMHNVITEYVQAMLGSTGRGTAADQRQQGKQAAAPRQAASDGSQVQVVAAA